MSIMYIVGIHDQSYLLWVTQGQTAAQFPVKNMKNQIGDDVWRGATRAKMCNFVQGLEAVS